MSRLNVTGPLLQFVSVASIASALLLAMFLSKSTAAESASDPKTARVWKAKCASCHGVDGKGQTEQGQKMSVPDMTDPKWQKENPDVKMREAILNGVKKKDKKEGMDGYRDVLTPEQVESLIAHARAFGR